MKTRGKRGKLLKDLERGRKAVLGRSRPSNPARFRSTSFSIIFFLSFLLTPPHCYPFQSRFSAPLVLLSLQYSKRATSCPTIGLAQHISGLGTIDATFGTLGVIGPRVAYQKSQDALETENTRFWKSAHLFLTSEHRTNQQPFHYPERNTNNIPYSSDIQLIDNHHRSATNHRKRGDTGLWRYPCNIKVQYNGLT